MSESTIEALKAKRDKAWDGYVQARAAVAAAESARGNASGRLRQLNPSFVSAIRAEIEALVTAEPGAEWTSSALAHAIHRRAVVLLSPKTMCNYYLPAVRAGNPHVVRNGREFLWYHNAAKGS